MWGDDDDDNDDDDDDDADDDDDDYEGQGEEESISQKIISGCFPYFIPFCMSLSLRLELGQTQGWGVIVI